MTPEHAQVPHDPRIQQAVDELTETIRSRYPDTTFAVQRGIDGPDETWLTATVDLDDPDEVIDLVIDRLLDLQVDQGIPLQVLPIHTPERLERSLQQRHLATRRGGRTPHLPV